MHVKQINGISVELPYEPYPAQIVTISKLLSSFQSKSSAIIESPTGTGKSLSIICSACAYNKANPTNKKKIFICSRTHKQIDQLIEQLRKTTYRPSMTILGSKQQYCIHSKARKSSDINEECSNLRKKRECRFFLGVEKLTKKTEDLVFDIEDFKKIGIKCGGCPYFAAREHAHNSAEIIFSPYNYLIDPKLRDSINLKLDNSIIIIDEAHNVEDCCRDAGSLVLDSKQIDILANELLVPIKKGLQLAEDERILFAQVLQLLKILRECYKIENFDTKSYEFSARIKKGKDVISALESVGLTKEAFLNFKSSYNSIKGKKEIEDHISPTSDMIYSNIERVLGAIFFKSYDCYAYCFMRYHKEKNKYTHNFWLLNPGEIFQPFVKDVHSITLLSGTLTPFKSFIHELSYNFDHQAIAPHILDKSQVFIATVKKGHLGKDLCGTYSIAETSEYLSQISKIIIEIADGVKNSGGTLVFVPSYSFLNRVKSTIPNCIVEPRNANMDEFDKIVNDYKRLIAAKKRAIFICVFRGKASEGIDFKDNQARAVISVGIPYPAFKDPQITCKKEYNDKKGFFNGRMWYETQAFRAVNQAIGRVVRHQKDWGSVFLLDSRYGENSKKAQLSKWASENIETYQDFSSCKSKYAEFVRNRQSFEKENILEGRSTNLGNSNIINDLETDPKRKKENDGLFNNFKID